MANVSTPHKDFDKYSSKWKRSRDASNGQDAVHAAGVAYLPKLKDEDPTDYDARKCRAGFYNATWRTLGGLLGMMFRKPPTKDLPAGVSEYEDDIDMAGTSLETFARKVALEVLEVGRVGIMVDHPRTDARPISVSAAQQLGLRPMLTTYRAECIVNWEYRRVRNHYVLAKVVLKECATEANGEWEVKEIEQYRVLDLDEANFYRVRVFQKANQDKGDWIVIDEFRPLMGGNPLEYIPFAIVGSDGIDSELDEPPLIDLVDVNLSHYRTNADYEHGCHFTGLPTPYVTGYQADPEKKEQFYIGSSAAWVFGDPNAKVGFLEFTGQGLDALKTNLERKEQQMAILGARMLFAQQRAVEAAETAAIHRTGESSVLASIATAVSEALEWALDVFCEWAGQKFDVKYQLNRDFNPAMLDASQLTALLKLVQGGQMSEQSLFDLMQRADIIAPDVDFEMEQERVAKDGPARPTAPANDAGVAA